MAYEQMVDGEAGYNNLHRAFLQAFLSRSILGVEEIKPILAAVQTAHGTSSSCVSVFRDKVLIKCFFEEGRPTLEGDITETDITNTVAMLNSRLSPLDLEIRSTRSQVDRSLFYALVNTTSDPLIQLATTRTADEIAFVKRILDAMFEGPNNSRTKEVLAVERVRAMQLAKVARGASMVNGHANQEGDESQIQSQNVGSLTITQAEKVLQDCVDEGWFSRSRAGYYSLAPRALMELRSWLKDTYNEPAEEEGDEPLIRIRDCEACREIVTVGLRCANLDCGCRLHDHCTRLFFRDEAEGERRCPKCKVEWTGDVFVGEKAARRRRSPARIQRSRRTIDALCSAVKSRPETAARIEARNNPIGVAITKPVFFPSSSTPGVASACRARKPALVRNASPTKNTRASPRRLAASLITSPSSAETSATEKTNQKCAR